MKGLDCVFVALSILLSNAPALAKTINSSDGKWLVEADIPDVFPLGRQSALVLAISSSNAAPAQASCPILHDVSLEMPQHGHGTDYAPTWKKASKCSWTVNGITPTMRGEWRLRFVLTMGEVTSVADFLLAAQ